MIEKISKLSGAKKWGLYVLVALSFALAKAPSVIAQNSAYGFLMSGALIVASGLFAWVIFELLVGFYFSALKDKIGAKIDYPAFMNIFRFFAIFLNIFSFLFFKIIILINFYPNFVNLFISLILNFLFILAIWLVVKKHFLADVVDKSKISLWWFGFGFMYLFLHTIMWGVI